MCLHFLVFCWDRGQQTPWGAAKIPPRELGGQFSGWERVLSLGVGWHWGVPPKPTQLRWFQATRCQPIELGNINKYVTPAVKFNTIIQQVCKPIEIELLFCMSTTSSWTTQTGSLRMRSCTHNLCCVCYALCSVCTLYKGFCSSIYKHLAQLTFVS